MALEALAAFGLGPRVSPGALADSLDAVASASSHALDLSANPAKAVALELADAQPLVWGGSVLAARASRRIAEAVRAASGRVALAADAGALLPLIAGARPRDPFADPFESGADDVRPTLVVVDDGQADAAHDEQRAMLEENARLTDVRVSTLAHTQGSTMERYVTLLAQGLFAAAYLQIGLGREHRR